MTVRILLYILEVMNLARQILGKDLYEITREDLTEYFSTPREESSVLEFKSGQVKINSIFKEICAFLNTEGGLIIVGSPKERKLQKAGRMQRRICQGRLIPSGFRDKNWIFGLIGANIVPWPQGIRIQEIRGEEGNYFIFEVPQSSNPPHQFLNDGRYYIRLEKEAKPAPHGLVEALFYKKVRAQLKADMSIGPLDGYSGDYNKVEISIRNTSSFPTDRVNYLIRVFNVQEVHENGEPRGNFLNGNDDSFELHGFSEKALVDERSLPISFVLTNKREPFIVSVIAWNREAGMYKHHGLFDPVNEQYIDRSWSGELHEKNLEDLHSTLRDIQRHI